MYFYKKLNKRKIRTVKPWGIWAVAVMVARDYFSKQPEIVRTSNKVKIEENIIENAIARNEVSLEDHSNQ